MVAIATRDSRAAVVGSQLQQLLDNGVALHAPTLLMYEVTNSLTRLIAAGRYSHANLSAAIAAIASVPIRLHDVTDPEAIIRTALRLGRKSAHDAAYLVLARQLGAELWTLDGPLPRNAASIGFRAQLFAET